QELSALSQVEDELTTLAAGKAPESGGLFSQGGNGGGHIRRQLGGGDHPIVVEIGPTLQTLEQGPRENGMAVGAVIGDLFVRSAGGEHLPRRAPGYFPHVCFAAGNAPAPHECEPAVT